MVEFISIIESFRCEVTAPALEPPCARPPHGSDVCCPSPCSSPGSPSEAVWARTAGRLGEVATNDQAAFLPRSAESTQVVEARKTFRQDETLPAIVVWTGASEGGELGKAQQAAATQALASMTGQPGIVGTPSPAVASKDGLALSGVVQLRPDLEEELPTVLTAVTAAAGTVPGTTAQLAGPAATQADLSDAFAGIDGLLLAVALAAVLLILLLVYRSVLLPLVIILGAVFALGLACAVVYVLADHDIVRVDGQVQGILSILVIGAATDYALLLAARYREELAAYEGDRVPAMRAALRQSVGPVTASAATVALGLLALLFSDLTNNRALGPVGAIGIVCAVLSALTFLPAVLVLLGRAAYWLGQAPAAWTRQAAATACGGGWRASWTAPRARCGRSRSAVCWRAPRSPPPWIPGVCRSTRSSSTTRRPSPPRRLWAATSRAARATRRW